MSQRKNFSSGAPWEDIAGYSRAVRVGNIVEVSGTVAVDENGSVVGENSSYLQTKYILQKIEKALAATGATLRDVVRTRMYVTNISQFEEIAKAHGEIFRDIKPCTTMVEVKALVAPGFLVEVEATAILP